MDKNSFETYYLMPHYETALIQLSTPKSFGKQYIKTKKFKANKRKNK